MRAASHRIAVLGDFMLDAYVTGSVSRVCPDSPAQVLDLEGEVLSAGGAGNVATGCAAFGFEAVACGFSGRDAASRALETLLAGAGVGLDGLVAVRGRSTLVKRRFGSAEQVLLRVDEGTTTPVAAQDARRLLPSLSRADAVLVSDYGYGSMSDDVIALLRQLRAASNMPLFVDAKQLGRYRDLSPDLVKPNYAQMCSLLRVAPAEDRHDHVERCAQDLLDVTGAIAAIVTLDGEGSVVVADGEVAHIEAPRLPVRSTSGAGDTFLVSLVAGMLSGEDLVTAARQATWSATQACESAGTVTASSAIDSVADRAKRIVPEDLRSWSESMKAAGRRIVLTNGCFDIFHAGHAHFLQEAAGAGDVLVVAVNTDERVRMLKGEGRPVNTLQDRLRVLEAVDVVCGVTWFEEPTAIHVVKRLRPDVYVKGSDYRGEQFPEEQYVRRHGGEVVFVDLLQGRSTSGIVDKVLGRGVVA